MVVTFAESHLPCFGASCCSLRCDRMCSFDKGYCEIIISGTMALCKRYNVIAVGRTAFTLCFIHSWLEERGSLCLNSQVSSCWSRTKRATVIVCWYFLRSQRCRLSLPNGERWIKSTVCLVSPTMTKSALSKVLSYAQSCLRRDLASGETSSTAAHATWLVAVYLYIVLNSVHRFRYMSPQVIFLAYVTLIHFNWLATMPMYPPKWMIAKDIKSWYLTSHTRSWIPVQRRQSPTTWNAMPQKQRPCGAVGTVEQWS